MSRPLVIEIGSIRIDAEGRVEDAARIEAVLREGLAALGERLKSSTFARDPEATGIALGRLRIDDLAVEDWLGPRGAARVADVLYERIAPGRSG